MKQKLCCVVLVLAIICGILPVEALAQGSEEDENVLQSLEDVPDVSDMVPAENQIVVVYEEAREDNVSCLCLDEADIVEGESLCDTVDLLTPDE